MPIKLVTLLLRKILYSGEETFIIENLPDETDAVREFERNCIQMTSVLYPTS